MQLAPFVVGGINAGRSDELSIEIGAPQLAAVARRGIEDLDKLVVLIVDGLGVDEPTLALITACRILVDFEIARPAMFELIARHDLLDGAGWRQSGAF